MLGTPIFFDENRDEEGVPFGVILSLVDVPLAIEIISRRSLNDITNAYSSSSLQVDDLFGEIQISARIFNLGDVDSHMTYLWLIVIANDHSVKTIRFRRSLAVKAKSYDDFLQPVTLAEAGVDDFSKIENIYAIVSDPMFDKFEDDLKKFIDFIANNDISNALNINPCRVSRKAGSWNLSQSPFQLNGNTLLHTKGFAEFLILGIDADANADFGILDNNGDKYPIISNLKGQALKKILTTVPLKLNNLVFYLDSELGLKLSNRISDCRLSSPSFGIIDLEWEDGGDGDYNDYQIRMIHR